MGNIRDLLNKIRYATYGKEVRQSIHDAIEECYTTASVDHDNANMEVKIARGTHNTLNERFASVEENIKNNSEQLETILNNKQFNNVFLHRGASEVCPENTLPAIYESSKMGVPFCEIDVRCTSDGVLVLHHDATIDRMTNGSGNISSLTLEQLKSFTIDNGNRLELYPNEKVPTLEEALIVSKKYGVKLMIHMYDLGGSTSAEGVKKLYDLLSKTFMIDNVILSGVNTYWYFYEMRKLNKTIPFSYVMSTYDTEHFVKVKELMPCYYGIIGRPSKTRVDECHSNGIKVVCDTVSLYTHYLEAVNSGVDIMLSDIIVGGDI